MKKSHHNRLAGFTVAEMMIAIGVVGILGTCFFRVLQTGLVLFTKNTAVNLAHEQARDGIARLTRDIHAAVSIPEMRTVTSVSATTVALATPSPSPTPIVSGSGTNRTVTSPSFAAVSFQNIAAGPNYIWQDPASASLIKIQDGGAKPVAGQHLVVPFWGSLYEADITAVTASGTANHSNVFLTNNVGTRINARAMGNAYAITYYTDRMAYAVVNGTYTKDNTGLYTGADANGNPVTGTGKTVKYVVAPAGTSPGQLYRFEGGELHMYKQRYSGSSFFWQDTATVARNITSPFPFSVPLNSGGSFNNKYVGVKLSASDPGSSNRNYAATNALLDTQIDYRTAVTLIQ